MARKQSEYLADLLGDDEVETPLPAPSPSALSPTPGADAQGGVPETSQENSPVPATEPSPLPRRPRGSMTLLGRESALARVANGEVRQVTQMLLDPARVRPWPGNARSYAHLTEENCRELIDSLVAEGGQKVPAVVRRIEGDPNHDYEVIAGTRRHWSISWLRANSWPDMKFLAQIADLDDEAAFRLADIENRARKDVSDLERARNYAAALRDHYGNHLTRMADRLKLSKGWLSKMLKVAKIPDSVIAAFGSPAEVQLKPAYPLAQALDDKDRGAAIRREAAKLAREQESRMESGRPPLGSGDVIARLLAAGVETDTPEKLVLDGAFGRPAITVQSANRQGVTLRLHAGHGLSEDDLMKRVRDALAELDDEGRGLQR